MDVVIYHNPRCSKSRAALALLEAQGIEPVVVEYLKDPPDAARLRHLLALLGLDPRALARRGEEAWRTAGLDDPDRSDAEIIDAMAAEPILIERPIVVVDDRRAVVGRPPERVLDIL